MSGQSVLALQLLAARAHAGNDAERASAGCPALHNADKGVPTEVLAAAVRGDVRGWCASLSSGSAYRASTIFFAFVGASISSKYSAVAMKFPGCRATRSASGEFVQMSSRAAALGHATHEADDLVALFAAGGADDVLHLVDGPFCSARSRTAAKGVQQDGVGGGLGLGEGIALGHKLARRRPRCRARSSGNRKSL